MPATKSLPAFHLWLLSATNGTRIEQASAIVIHGSQSAATPQLSNKIAAYLNEYDGEGEGRWIAIPAELVTTIAADPSQRALLGIGESCVNCPPSSPCGLKKTLGALAKHGHVILNSPLAAAATRNMENVFHIGIGLPPDSLDECHVIINPELFPISCIPQVIADIFLEWSTCGKRCEKRAAIL